MDVSVVIPCRDASHLAVQLDSLVHQTYRGDWEVLIVDNGSHGGAARVASRFSDRLPLLRLVDALERAGAAYARNVGSHLAKGDFLLFVDADDAVDGRYVEAMERALRAADLVCARVDVNKLNAGGSLGSLPYHPQETGPITKDFRFLPFAGGSTLGVRASVFADVGGFDEALSAYEEADFCWRVQLAGYTGPVFTPDAVSHYRVRDSLAGRYRQGREWGKAQAVLYKRYRTLGLPRKPVFLALAGWARPVMEFARGRTRGDLLCAAGSVGMRMGRVQGSLRERVLYL